MEQLIPTVNKLQDVFNTLSLKGNDKCIISLPQIVVVGNQSSGKSSILESLVGKSFLPRGTGIVTRVPLVLQLVHVPIDDNVFRSAKDGTQQLKEWAKFLHREDIFDNFDDVLKEIEEETNRLAGKNKGVCDKPITLKIYSNKVTNITLVDLPGITKVPVGDQPADIEAQIMRLIEKYIRDDKSLILTVTPANTDLSTSESLKLARSVDPEGKRTIAVISKLDLMDAGTDAYDVLCGRVIPVKLGIVGVVNRSQKHTMEKKSIEDALKDEEKFFQTKYPELAHQNGTAYLAKTLQHELMHHIRNCLPELRSRVRQLISQCEETDRKYGKEPRDKAFTMLKLIERFSSCFCAAIEGRSTSDKLESELCGGAKIASIFKNTFANELNSIYFLEDLTQAEISLAIRNATGIKPNLYVPERAFHKLVKPLIGKLLKPSLNCLSEIHREMKNIAQNCDEEMKEDFQQFPKLHEQIVKVTNELLTVRKTPTTECLEMLLDIEKSYINTEHPDLKKHEIVQNCTNWTEMPKKDAKKLPDTTESPNYQLPGKNQRNDSQKNDRLTKLTYKLSENERKECDIIEDLLKSYLKIVQSKIQDTVPKAIYHHLVKNVEDNLHTELIRNLHKPEQVDKLMSESDHIKEIRRKNDATLHALVKTESIIAEIDETQFFFN